MPNENEQYLRAIRAAAAREAVTIGLHPKLRMNRGKLVEMRAAKRELVIEARENGVDSEEVLAAAVDGELRGTRAVEILRRLKGQRDERKR